MSSYERAVRLITDRFEGVGSEYSRDVALTTRDLSHDARLGARCLQLVSLVGLALRLRARSRTRSRPDEVWRQGMYLGGAALLGVIGARLWISVAAPPAGASASLEFARVIAAIALSAALCCSLLSRRGAAVGLAGAGAVLGAFATDGLLNASFASYCVVATVGLLAGSTTTSARGRSSVVVVSAIALASWSLPFAVNASVAGSVTFAVSFWLLPLALMLLGSFDPRLAATATTLLFSRLAASGFDELAQALNVLQQSGQRALLARWVLMGVAVPAAWFATTRSTRRLTRL